MPIESLERLLPNTFGETMASSSALGQLATICMSVPAVLVTRTGLETTCRTIDRWATKVRRGQTGADDRP
jgi:hypothetical protein